MDDMVWFRPEDRTGAAVSAIGADTTISRGVFYWLTSASVVPGSGHAPSLGGAVEPLGLPASVNS